MVQIVTPDTPSVRPPPHSMTSEQSVIGGLLLSHGQAYDRIDWLPPEAFYRSEHREIYTAIQQMVERGQPTDALTVGEHMRVKGEAQAYIGTLALNTPSAANIVRYAEIVRDKWQLRRVIAITAEAQDKAYQDRASGKEIAEQAEQSLLNVLSASTGEEVSFETAVRQAIADLEEPARCLVKTGFNNLDSKLNGGLRGGQLIVIAGRPGMGKSALAFQIAERVAHDETVAGFTLEMQSREVAGRSLKYHEGLTDRLTAARRLIDLKLRLDDTPAVTVGHIRLRCRRIQRKHGLSLVVVDYLQLMRGVGENRTQEVGSISRGLKALAKELDVPVILLSQLNRKVEDRTDRRPMMQDLRECLPVDEWVDTPAGPVQLKSRPPRIVTVDGQGASIADCSYIEKRYNSTYRVATQFGSFSATARHQVLTGVGWKAVRDIVPGRDVIACPKRIPHANRGALPHARLLGWMLGNGSTSGTPGLIYRNELEAAVAASIIPFGVSIRKRSVQKSDNVTDAYLSCGTESGCHPNPLMTWIRSLGLEGKTACFKEIPAEYLGSSDETHKAILRGLWETDGTVTGGSAKYATASEVLARQVKWLLHTIGVRSTVSFYENGHAGMWEVRCAAQDSANLGEICGDRRRFGELSAPSERYVDRAPAIFAELASEIYRGEQRFQRRRDGEIKQISKERMRNVLAECPISTIAESPYMTMDGMGWASVHSVDPEETEVRVCDLHVPGTNCFLASGLVVHNSGDIEQDADIIIMLYRDEYYHEGSPWTGLCEALIRKQRGGPTGMAVLTFKPEVTRFGDYSGSIPQSQQYVPRGGKVVAPTFGSRGND